MVNEARDLVLRSRIEQVKRTLTQVESITDSLHPRAQMRSILSLPSETEVITALANLDLNVAGARHTLRLAQAELSPDTSNALIEELENIEETVSELRDRLEQATADAHFVVEHALLMDMSGENGDGPATAAAKFVEAKANEVRDSVADLSTATSELEAAAAQQDDAQANETLKAAWATYWQVVGEGNQVFREYVELLGGLAMRDVGFDRDICRLADQLGELAAANLDLKVSLSIPAWEEREDMTVARIIRLGFPEWTIWSLPLAAHELGHVVVGVIHDIITHVEQVERTDEEKRRLRVYLADAFATYVMGPAYACAVLLTRLDPRAASTDDGFTLTRAQVILGMLGRLDERAGGQYGDLITRLETAWCSALEQSDVTIDKIPGCAGSTEQAAQSDTDGAAEHALENGGPGTAESEDVDTWLDLIEHNVGAPLRLDEEVASDIMEWSQQLGRQEEDFDIGPDDEVRFALNAAWIARLEILPGHDLETLERQAEDLIQLIPTTDAKYTSGKRLTATQDPGTEKGHAGSGGHG